MSLSPYRQVLAVPGVRPLLLIAMFARVPVTAIGVTLTLYVVDDLHLGYARAGLVGAAATVGSALGAPLLGRLVDRRGLRPMLVITTAAEAVFWSLAPNLPYLSLVVAAFVAGLLTLPVFSVVRQSLAALVPEGQRRQAYSLDSMSVEVSFMAGPALAVLAVSVFSARATMYALGVAMVAAGLTLILLDPPTKHEDDAAAPAGARRRDWFGRRLFAVLLVSAAATFVLGGTDIAIVAALRASGDQAWIGVVLIVWGAFSLFGGFVHGTVKRPLPPVVIVAAMGLLTMPVGLLGNDWWLLSLAIIPAGVLCAPTLAATAESVSRVVPGYARGEAMGWHGAAITVGISLGAPAAGAVIDTWGPAAGFVVAGGVGAVAALLSLPALGRGATTPAGPAPTVAGPVEPAGPALTEPAGPALTEPAGPALTEPAPAQPAAAAGGR
jgi:predicted MFS family arabinose efflux permease